MQINRKQKFLLCCMQSVEIGTIHLKNLFHQLFSLIIFILYFWKWPHIKCYMLLNILSLFQKMKLSLLCQHYYNIARCHVILFYINLDKYYLGVFVLAKNQVHMYWIYTNCSFCFKTLHGSYIIDFPTYLITFDDIINLLNN